MSIQSVEKPQEHTPASRLSLLALILFTAVFALFIYTFLHEAGHALAGLAFGQTITNFDLSFWDFSAHVALSGSLTLTQRAVQSAAGAALPFLLWSLFVVLVPRRGSLGLELLKLISSMAVVNSLLPWLIIPLLVLLHLAPAADDVTHFLQASQMPPLLLTAVSAICYVFGWWLFWRKIDGLKLQLRQLRENLTGAMAGSRTAVLAMIIVLGLCLGAAFTLDHQAGVTPPPDFTLVSETDLSVRAYEAESLLTFTLEETAVPQLFLTMAAIDTPYFGLSLVGPDGASYTIMHGEDFRTDRNGSGQWSQSLPPGTYDLQLTTAQSSGQFTVYWKRP